MCLSIGKTLHLCYRAVNVRKKNDAVEPPLWDTSIQGPQNLVPEKLCSHTLCIDGFHSDVINSEKSK